MTDTLNGVKRKAMGAVVHDNPSLNGLEKKYWEHVLQFGGGTSGSGAVDSVNGKTGVVTISAADVGAYTKGEVNTAVDAIKNHVVTTVNGAAGDVTLTPASIKAEPARSLGTIGLSDDPTTKPAGDYYVTGAFIDAPTLASGEAHTGVMRIVDDFDGSNNGSLITYYTDKHVFYRIRFAGGWVADWRELLTTDSDAFEAIEGGIASLTAKNAAVENDVAQLKHDVAALQASSGQPAPAGAPWSSVTAHVSGGYTTGWGDVATFSSNAKGGDITIAKTGSTSQYAFIALSPTDAKHVKGIKIDGGLPALWESKGVTIQGKQYVMFMSPYKFTKTPLDIEVEWK